MTSAAHSLKFGDLLRSWRSERRFTQADLANVIETPSRHVSFLETGRSKPSREMVTRLATALQIPLRDRNLLLRSAGFADIYTERQMPGEEMSMLRQAVTRLMTAHDPYPSFVVDRDWNVQDANGSGRLLFMPISAAFPLNDPERPPNMLDITFSHEGIRPYILNWEDYARQSIQRIHREALSQADVRRALDRIGRHPDLPKDWWAFDVRYTLNPIFTVHLQSADRRLNFFSVMASIAVPTAALAQELRVETLFPADKETEGSLAAMAGM